MLKIHGQGYVVNARDIVAALVRRYQTNPNSILPSDFCYNRWHRGISADEVEPDSEEYREGKQKTVQLNIHERNPAARLACIQKYGAKCYVCGFDLS